MLTQQHSDVLSRLEKTLSARRLEHTLAVSREMESLCDAFGVNTQKDDLVTAALLHDVTKEKTAAEQLQMCRDCGIILRAEDKAAPKGLHAITAAYVCQTEYGLSEEISSAVRYHTTGRAGMTLFEKLLFLADYIEDTRTWAPCIALRRTFYRDLSQATTPEEKAFALSHAVRVGIDSTLSDLIDEGRFIHPDTIAARNDLIAKGY